MGKAALAVVLLVLLGASVADCKVRGSLVASAHLVNMAAASLRAHALYAFVTVIL